MTDQYDHLNEAERIAAAFDDFAARCAAGGQQVVAKCAERTAMALRAAPPLGESGEGKAGRPVCWMCNGKGKTSAIISGETHGPQIDAERAEWARRHPIPCPACGGSGFEENEKLDTAIHSLAQAEGDGAKSLPAGTEQSGAKSGGQEVPGPSPTSPTPSTPGTDDGGARSKWCELEELRIMGRMAEFQSRLNGAWPEIFAALVAGGLDRRAPHIFACGHSCKSAAECLDPSDCPFGRAPAAAATGEGPSNREEEAIQSEAAALQEVERLTAELEGVRRERDRAQTKFDEMLKAEHDLSDAYLRLRNIIPHALDPRRDDVWRWTEACATRLRTRAETAEAALNRAQKVAQAAAFYVKMRDGNWGPQRVDEAAGQLDKALNEWGVQEALASPGATAAPTAEKAK